MTNLTPERSLSILTPDGFTLRGLLVDPPQAQTVAVICHGIDSHKQEYLDMNVELAQRLAAVGIASLRFDFRGHGDSSGTTLDFDVTAQIIDLDTVMRWLDDRGGHAQSTKLFVGISFGAAPGLFWATTRTPFSRLCLFAPVLSYDRTFLNPTTAWAKASFNPEGYKNAERVGYLMLDDNFRVSLRLIEQMRLLDPVSALDAASPQSVLLIHGTADALVPCQISERVGDGHPAIQLHIVRDMDHGMFVAGDDDGLTAETHALRSRLMELIVEHLRGA